MASTWQGHPWVGLRREPDASEAAGARLSHLLLRDFHAQNLQSNTKLDAPHSKRLLCPRLPYPMVSVHCSTNTFGDPLRSPQLMAGLQVTLPHPAALQPTRNEERSLPGRAQEHLCHHHQPRALLPSPPLPPLPLLIRPEIAKPTKLTSKRFKAEQFNPCSQLPGRSPASCRPGSSTLRRLLPCRGPRRTPSQLPRGATGAR